MRWLTTPLPVAAVLLTGCSPYVYTAEINGFSSGVSSVSATYDAGRQWLANDTSSRQDQAFAAGRAQLDVTDGCSQADAGPDGTFPACAIVARNSTAPPPLPRNLVLVNTAGAAFTALKAYTAALASVTNANDDAALTAAINGLATSAESLSQATAKLAPKTAAVGGLIKTSNPLLAWGAKSYLDQRRYKALRGAVPAVDADIAQLADVAATALLDIRAAQVRALEQQVAAARDQVQGEQVAGLTASAYQARLTDLETKMAAFTTARAADPQGAAAKMKATHHALAQALLNNSHETKAVFDAALAFATAADALAPAAAKPASGGGGSK
jgi:hypothetical protein